MFLYDGHVLPVELKIGEIVGNWLIVKAVRSAQIRWAKILGKGLLPLLPVTPDVDRPSTFQARFLDRAGRCAGAFGLGEVGFE